MKILYFHGRYSSPKTGKAAHIRAYTEHNVFVPSYPSQEGTPQTSIPKCYPIAKQALLSYKPDIVVGSSYGGGILLKLLHEGLWTGPSLLLAGAGVRYGIADHLPEEVPTLLIHGTQDEKIPVEDSRLLADSSDRAQLVEIQDTHALSTIKQGLLVLGIRYLERFVRKI